MGRHADRNWFDGSSHALCGRRLVEWSENRSFQLEQIWIVKLLLLVLGGQRTRIGPRAILYVAVHEAHVRTLRVEERRRVSPHVAEVALVREHQVRALVVLSLARRSDLLIVFLDEQQAILLHLRNLLPRLEAAEDACEALAAVHHRVDRVASVMM